MIVATFSRIDCVSVENHDTLASNATAQASKLLKKNEQCVAVLAATHMFYNEKQQIEQRVLECFKKAIKIAASCVQSNPKLVGTYISILNKFFYYIHHINVNFFTNAGQTRRHSELHQIHPGEAPPSHSRWR